MSTAEPACSGRTSAWAGQRISADPKPDEPPSTSTPANIRQAPSAHRGRKAAPLYGMRSLLRAGAEKLTDRQGARSTRDIDADDRHLAVWPAWSCTPAAAGDLPPPPD